MSSAVHKSNFSIQNCGLDLGVKYSILRELRSLTPLQIDVLPWNTNLRREYKEDRMWVTDFHPALAIGHSCPRTRKRRHYSCL